MRRHFLWEFFCRMWDCELSDFETTDIIGFVPFCYTTVARVASLRSSSLVSSLP